MKKRPATKKALSLNKETIRKLSLSRDQLLVGGRPWVRTDLNCDSKITACAGSCMFC
jgi:hypothetical protein